MQIKVHTELAKLRLKNREENAQVRADARAAYEQRIQDAANDSFADSSCLASFIENSVTGTVAALLLLFIVEMCSLILCVQKHFRWSNPSSTCNRACYSTEKCSLSCSSFTYLPSVRWQNTANARCIQCPWSCVRTVNCDISTRRLPSSNVCKCELLSPSRPAQFEDKVPFVDIVLSEDNITFEEKFQFEGEVEC